MSTSGKRQVNFRLEQVKYNKLKALSEKEGRTIANYARRIIEQFLKSKYFPKQPDRSTENENQIG